MTLKRNIQLKYIIGPTINTPAYNLFSVINNFTAALALGKEANKKLIFNPIKSRLVDWNPRLDWWENAAPELGPVYLMR